MSTVLNKIKIIIRTMLCMKNGRTEALPEVNKMTDVTIRGIDDEVYSRFAAEAKKSGKAIGELTTEVMRAFVDRDVPKTYKIQNIDNLTVSRSDLESMDGKVSFTNIDELEFLEDVDWTTFRDKVDIITNIDKIVLPPTLSKLQVLSKAKNIDSLVTKR